MLCIQLWLYNLAINQTYSNRKADCSQQKGCAPCVPCVGCTGWVGWGAGCVVCVRGACRVCGVCGVHRVGGVGCIWSVRGARAGCMGWAGCAGGGRGVRGTCRVDIAILQWTRLFIRTRGLKTGGRGMVTGQASSHNPPMKRWIVLVVNHETWTIIWERIATAVISVCMTHRR